MSKVSFRIRKKYFEAIKRGVKKVELRADTPFWRKRLEKFPQVAVFVCGKDVHRRRIVGVGTMPTPARSKQGMKDIPTERCFVIVLGGEVEDVG